LLAVGCWLLANSLSAQINSDSLISVYAKKMQMYLDKDKKATEVFSFTKQGIEMYKPKTDTSERVLDFILNWNEMDVFTSVLRMWSSRDVYDYCKLSKMKQGGELKYPSSVSSGEYKPGAKPKGVLSGFMIALDPGHIAGDLETAKMEKKWVEIKNPPAQLIEGELTLQTALLLKRKLEAQGVTVMLTREQPNISAFGIDFVKWTDSLYVNALEDAYKREDVSFEEKNYLLTKANNTEIFRRFFLLEDLRERARKINEFHPDMTLIMHYNVDETNTNWNKPTKKDYNMTFVGGGFNEDELVTPESRIEFLRLMLTDDIERSMDFSKYIIESLVQKTGVPAALDTNAIYLRDNCMKTDLSGVFCRNLTLTRKVKGVVCYGESLYQDNINECKALSKKDVKIGEMETSKRVEEVAEAYFEGIMNYIKSKNK
jgi:N-acetylmuramoyl-L-alanine amidase